MRVPSPTSAAAVSVVVLFALLTASCGDDAPAASTPPVTVPQPAPNPNPNPTPIGGGGDSFFHAACALGEGDPGASCARGQERMLNVYEDAIDLLVEQQPAIFDLTDEFAPGTKAYRVKDKEAYMNGIVTAIRARGLCAERDPDDGAQETIRMKLGNEFSEDYDVLLASGHMRRGMGAYRASCTPAAFPVEREEDAPPIGSGCGRPYPPPVTRINCKVHIKAPDYFTLDSTPIVGHNAAYCMAMGYPEGTSLCPVRPYGWDDKVACEAWRVGKAADTGRPGPTWRRLDNGALCTGPESGCVNHPSNQFSLYAYASVCFTACAENGACCVDPACK